MTLADKDNKGTFFEKNKVKTFSISCIDIDKMFGIMSMVTLISLYFGTLGFGEANIITVFILGVLTFNFLYSER